MHRRCNCQEDVLKTRSPVASWGASIEPAPVAHDSPTLASIRAWLATIDRTPIGYQGEYPRIISATEVSPGAVFKLELVVYRVASLTDGPNFGNRPAIARSGRSCSTSTIDVTNGADSAQATTEIVDCLPGTPERPARKDHR